VKISAALVIVAALVLGTSAASAEAGTGEGDDARYSFSPAGDGYLRLDGRTGQVSLCTRQTVGWACRAVPDERSALEGEIARLQGENVALKKELIARHLPLPGTVRPDPPSAPPGPPAPKASPGDPELSKVVNFVEKVWRRLVEMIAAVRKDILDRT
jgi:hypothetical protein